MGSNANIAPQKFELSSARVTYDGVDLGATLGNITIKPKYDTAELKADQTGLTILDRRVSGFACTVEFEVAQIKDVTLWKKVFPHAVLVGTAPNQKLIFVNNIGDSQLALAKTLQIHPLSMEDADKTQDYYFWKTLAMADSQIVYDPTKQASLKMIMTVYYDASTSPGRFFSFGDPAIVGTNASAAAAVAGGGNVGNGTVTGLVVHNQGTVTETITLQCVTAITNSGKFYVSGSVSGALGLATVGTPFVAPGGQIDFTINDGATDFAVNDSFTIATTAAS